MINPQITINSLYKPFPKGWFIFVFPTLVTSLEAFADDPSAGASLLKDRSADEPTFLHRTWGHSMTQPLNTWFKVISLLLIRYFCCVGAEVKLLMSIHADLNLY